jgi:hypothetical protein
MQPFNHDEVYAEFINAHQGLDNEQSALLNAKLIFLLCEHIKDESIIKKIINIAKQEKITDAN